MASPSWVAEMGSPFDRTYEGLKRWQGGAPASLHSLFAARVERPIAAWVWGVPYPLPSPAKRSVANL
ncbi:hypothetical protein TthHB5008_11230 [Thermus thermophilus]|nr:hypothetical protein TthHB5002_11260 [Thermus thermophilus]BCQ00353.1 hypothetical protein TthHB5008_11230 [Thermus thermophilus]